MSPASLEYLLIYCYPLGPIIYPIFYPSYCLANQTLWGKQIKTITVEDGAESLAKVKGNDTPCSPLIHIPTYSDTEVRYISQFLQSDETLNQSSLWWQIWSVWCLESACKTWGREEANLQLTMPWSRQWIKKQPKSVGVLLGSVFYCFVSSSWGFLTLLTAGHRRCDRLTKRTWDFSSFVWTFLCLSEDLF